METKIITIKRIANNTIKNNVLSFFILDNKNNQYQFTCNDNYITPTIEVLSLAKEKDKLNIKFTNKKTGPLDLHNLNIIFEAKFDEEKPEYW